MLQENTTTEKKNFGKNAKKFRKKEHNSRQRGIQLLTKRNKNLDKKEHSSRQRGTQL